MARIASDTKTTFCAQVAALPWRFDKSGKVEVLLITSRQNGKWMLPKGWPITGRTPAEAAMLEAREEGGVSGVVYDAPIGSYRYLKIFDDGSSRPSQALIYSLRVTNELGDWDERKQRRRKWMRPRKAARVVFEPDLARFLANLSAGRIFLS